MQEASMDSEKKEVREREGSDAGPVEAKKGEDSDENDAAKVGDDVSLKN